MKVVTTKYAVRDPETDTYLTGGGPYDRMAAFEWDRKPGSLLARLFDTESHATAAINKTKRGRAWKVSAEQAARLVIVPVVVTYEVQP